MESPFVRRSSVALRLQQVKQEELRQVNRKLSVWKRNGPHSADRSRGGRGVDSDMAR